MNTITKNNGTTDNYAGGDEIIDDAKRDAHIRRAREQFDNMKNGRFSDFNIFSPVESAVKSITENLKAAGVPLSALFDSSGFSLPEEAATIIFNDAVRDAHILRARDEFDALKNDSHPINPDNSRQIIYKSLKAAKVGLEAILGSGKDPGKMAAELDNAVRDAHIKTARYEFNNLRNSLSVSHSIESLNSHLKAAGVGLEALDHEGKKSAKEMAAELNNAVRDAHILWARKKFDDMKAGYDPLGSKAEMDYHLEAAGSDYTALESGKQTLEEMTSIVNAAARDAYIRVARKEFNALKNDGHPINPDYSRQIIDKNLKAANVGLEAIFGSGKDPGKMAAELDNAVRDAHIKTARYEFNNLRNSLSVSHSIESLNSHLKAAGVGLEALDPEGKKSAEEMARIIEAIRQVRYKDFKPQVLVPPVLLPINKGKQPGF